MTTKEELQKQIHELQAKLDAMPDDKPTGRWKPKVGQEYWFLSSTGMPEIATWADDGFDYKAYSLNNVYKTKEEAEEALEQRLATVRVLDRIAELNAQQGWVCDWDDNTHKFYIDYDNLGGGHCIKTVTIRNRIPDEMWEVCDEQRN